jgi:group I intron endonuclease
MHVYLVLCLITGKGCVGQTRNPIRYRWRKHLTDATKGEHWALHRAMRKYGGENFAVIRLGTVATLDELNKLEAESITKYNTLIPSGYNMTRGGEGYEWTDEARVNLSKALTGRKRKPFSEEHRRNIGLSKRGNTYKRGRKMSAEQYELLKNTHWTKRKPASMETRLKQSIALKGRVFSDEERQKISAGIKAAWVRRKAEAANAL